MGSMDTPTFIIDQNVERIIVHDWMDWMIRAILARSGPKKLDIKKFAEAWKIFMNKFPKDSPIYRQSRMLLNLINY